MLGLFVFSVGKGLLRTASHCTKFALHFTWLRSQIAFHSGEAAVFFGLTCFVKTRGRRANAASGSPGPDRFRQGQAACVVLHSVATTTWSQALSVYRVHFRESQAASDPH